MYTGNVIRCHHNNMYVYWYYNHIIHVIVMASDYITSIHTCYCDGIWLHYQYTYMLLWWHPITLPVYIHVIVMASDYITNIHTCYCAGIRLHYQYTYMLLWWHPITLPVYIHDIVVASDYITSIHTCYCDGNMYVYW
jgi:hypothetical protein